MKKRVIHSKFSIDLANLKLTEVEENSLFSDSFFYKYSFPFETELTEELDKAFGNISLYNSVNIETKFDVKYLHDNIIEDAVLEIETIYTDKVSCTLKYGIDQLPGFGTKLPNLDLQHFTLHTIDNIYNHANRIIPLTYPETNYNFPQVHTDKYEKSDDTWFHFEGIINNRKEGNFLTNTYDITEEESYNRNIMQPLPYLMYVLKQGFKDSNLTLTGDIVNDTLLQKCLIFSSAEYFKKYELNQVLGLIHKRSDEYDMVGWSSPDQTFNKYTGKENVSLLAYYNIRGFIYYKRLFQQNFLTPDSYLKVYVDNVQIFQKDFPALAPFDPLTNHREEYYLDIFTTITNPGAEIKLELVCNSRITHHLGLVNDVMDVNLIPVRLVDVNGNPYSSVINENEINLKRAVPNISFGDLIKVVKNWFNYDLKVVDDTAIMNKIENYINYNDVIDISETEIKRPKRVHKQRSFLLKFAKTSDTNIYEYEEVYHSKTMINTSGFTTDENTKEIEINALPLPNTNKDNIFTAHAFEDDENKVYLVIYDGLVNGKNYTKINEPLLLPQVHKDYWKKYLTSRIFAQSFTWLFRCSWNEALKLSVKKKVYAYKNVFLLKSINKKQISPDTYEVEIEGETVNF